MNVQDYFTALKGIAKRGNALDADLPSVLRRAMSFIEMNYNLSHMLVKTDVVVSADAGSLEIVDGAGLKLKSIKTLGYTDSDGTWYYLKQVDPGDFTATTGDNPQGFIMTKTSNGWALEFDTTWAEETIVSYWAYHYTDWDGDTTADDLWLINNAEEALTCRCMILIAVIIRDPTLLQMYNQLWGEAVTVMMQDDGERVQGSR
jgi:hypothetical protein